MNSSQRLSLSKTIKYDDNFTANLHSCVNILKTAIYSPFFLQYCSEEIIDIKNTKSTITILLTANYV